MKTTEEIIEHIESTVAIIKKVASGSFHKSNEDYQLSLYTQIDDLENLLKWIKE